MILMAADYVGYKITEYLCQKREPIDVFVYDVEDRGGYNYKMLQCIYSSYHDITVFTNRELDNLDVKAMIKSREIEIGILAWWPYIIDNSIISLTHRGFVNTHPSYLPFNRGKHPYFWSIVDGTPFGVTIHYVNTDIDAGEIIAQREIPISWTDTGGSLYLKSREEMIELFCEIFEKIKANLIRPEKQNLNCGTMHYGKMLEPFCEINLDQQYTARQLLNIIRGRTFAQSGGSSFVENGKKYFISIKIDQASSDGELK